MTDIVVETVNPELEYAWLVVPVGTPTRIRPQGPAGHAKGLALYCPGGEAPPANTAPVFFGRENVTADRSETGGVPIGPGRSFNLPVNDGSEVYAIAAVEGQYLCWASL